MTKAKPNFSIPKNSHAIVYHSDARTVLKVETDFAFVINVSNVPSSAGLELAPGLQLRKANGAEIAAIKDVLEKQAGVGSYTPWQNTKVREGDNHWSHPPLPEDQWRYFVVGFEGSNASIAELEQVLSIAPMELKLGFTLLRSAFAGQTAKTPTLIFDPGRLFSQVQRAVSEDLSFVEMTAATASEILNIHQAVKICDRSLVNVERLSEQMLGLDALPYESHLLFLGYFAILEALLTHAPNPKDTIDSITRQVKRKLLLLDNRWQPRLDYAAFAGGTPEKIWSQMYAYRSALAHGSEPDFKTELKLLNTKSALTLLLQTVRSVFRQAITEPQLIFDLRNC
jgi:hypothetical protein